MSGIVRFWAVDEWRDERPRLDRRIVVLVATMAAIAVLATTLAVRLVAGREGDILVGAVEDLATTLPSRTVDPPLPGVQPLFEIPDEDGPGIRPPGAPAPARPRGVQRLLDPTGRPYGAPIPFNADIPVPPGLVWVLLIGSDARPGEQVLRSRADSIHLLAANPATGQATIIGFPRDSFVEIPDHGTGKINTTLGLGGPELLARTVNRFTGLPVQYWVVAGFEAFKRVVDDVGGVDVEVASRMDDWDSGAHFQPGWHHFDGEQALAFSRNRHEFADGDLSRSRNQGFVILAALAKLRSEVGDEAGLLRWLGVAFRHLVVDLDHEQARQLLAVARRTDPADVTNLVLQGRGGMAGSQSVVYLDAQAAARIADDVRPDAAIGPAKPLPTIAPPTTTSTLPPPPPNTSPVTAALVPTEAP